jgi:hypothetical protein
LTPDAQIYDWMRAWRAKNVDPILPYLEGVDHLVLERLTEPVELAVLPNGKILGDAFDVSTFRPRSPSCSFPTGSRGVPRLPATSILAVAGPTGNRARIRVDQLIGRGRCAERAPRRAIGVSARRLRRSSALRGCRYAELEVPRRGVSFKRAIVSRR